MMPRRTRFIAIAVLLGGMFAAVPAAAQAPTTARVTRAAVVLEQPRGDSLRVATVSAGDVLEVHEQQGAWFRVTPQTPPGTAPPWERGWIHASYLDSSVAAAFEAPARAPGRLQIRGFGQAGGTLFTADDSFDTILGSPFGPIVGGGAQVVFPNSAFVQVSFERFRETGSRALVSGDQVFTVDTPATIEVRPVMVTVGYLAREYGRFAPYLGGGIGWHTLTEESPSVANPVRESKVGYHLVAGTEFGLARWVALAGEVQWAAVPDLIGETGISAAFQEDDLGGTTFRFKFIIGY